MAMGESVTTYFCTVRVLLDFQSIFDHLNSVFQQVTHAAFSRSVEIRMQKMNESMNNVRVGPGQMQL